MADSKTSPTEASAPAAKPERRICLSSWAWPWLFTPYGAQLRGLIRHFSKVENLTVYCLIFGNELPTGEQSFDDVYERHNDGGKMGEHYDIDALKKVKFIGGSTSSGKTGAMCSETNGLLRSYRIDAYVYLGDLPLLICDEKFTACTSFVWYPLHHAAMPGFERSKLKVFSDIISLAPSDSEKLADLLTDHIVHYIPHFIDAPKPPELSKKELRAKHNIPEDAYVVMIHSGNYEKYSRKALYPSIFAFNDFYNDHPDAYLLLHAWTMQKLEGNEHLSYHGFTDVGGILPLLDVPRERIHHNDVIIPATQLEEFFAMSDVLLHGSKVEGFGLPVLEAQLRGLPVVTTAVGAMKDYTYYGHSVPPVQREYFPGMRTIWYVPHIQGMVDALTKLYDARENTSPDRQAAIDRIASDMDQAAVATRFLALFESAKRNPRQQSLPLFRRFHYDEPNNQFLVYHNNEQEVRRRTARIELTDLDCEWALFIDNCNTIENVNLSNLYGEHELILFPQKLADGALTPKAEELQKGIIDMKNTTFACKTKLFKHVMTIAAETVDAKHLRQYILTSVLGKAKVCLDNLCVVNA